MKTLTLDFSTWRAGGDGFSTWRAGGDGRNSKIGKGDTELLNRQGSMCCLGQFASQCELPQAMLLGQSEPGELDINRVREVSPDYANLFMGTRKGRNSSIATRLIAANDNLEITTKARVEKIRSLLKKKQIELLTINFPENSGVTNNG